MAAPTASLAATHNYPDGPCAGYLDASEFSSWSASGILDDDSFTDWCDEYYDEDTSEEKKQELLPKITSFRPVIYEGRTICNEYINSLGNEGYQGVQEACSNFNQQLYHLNNPAGRATLGQMVKQVVNEALQVENDPAKRAELERLAQDAQSLSDSQSSKGCSIWDGGFVECAIKNVIAWIMSIIQWIFFRILWAANEVFAYCVKLSVMDFKKLVDLEPITRGWTILRDLCNIFFIFILLYIAIETIIGGGKSKGLLPKVILLALLINFSAVVPKVVIDVSNMLSLQIYENMGDGQFTALGAPNVTGALMQSIGFPFTGLGDGWGAATEKIANNSGWLQLFVTPILNIIFSLVLAFLLLAAGALFILRAVHFLFAIVFSPLAFMALVAPGQKGHFDKWKKDLFSNAIFAPVYLFLLYLSIKMIAVSGNVLGVGSGQITADTPGGLVASIIQFVLAVVFMVYSLIYAKGAGIHGASTLSDWGKTSRKWAQGVTGSNTLGRLGKKLAENKSLTSWDAKGNWAARLARRGSSAMSDAKFGSNAGFNARQKATAERAGQDMKGMSSEEKASYLAGRWGNQNMYGSMSANDRAKMETAAMAAAKKAEEAAESAGETGGTREGKIAEEFTKLREALKGEEKDKTNEALVKAGKDTVEQVENLAKIAGKESENIKDAFSTFEKMGTGRQAEIMKELQKSNSALADKLSEKMDAKSKQDMEEVMGKMENQALKQTANTDIQGLLQKIGTTIGTAQEKTHREELKSLVAKITDKDNKVFSTMSSENLTSKELVAQFDMNIVKEGLQKNKGLKVEHKQVIGRMIREMAKDNDKNMQSLLEELQLSPIGRIYGIEKPEGKASVKTLYSPQGQKIKDIKTE